MNDPTQHQPRKRRTSRYQRAQDRRKSQRRADQRFYNSIFGVIGACVLVVLGLAMIASSGNAPTISGNAENLTQRTFLRLTGLEIGGLIVVGIIGVFMWRRIKKR
ncbi:hypothetical protein AB6B39_09085 [Algimonas porphyrae]|uniref:hypothetical protein n=1 Tax=Algimonas porphyrae TaxID=1128113 RepID=UPI00352B7BB9